MVLFSAKDVMRCNAFAFAFAFAFACCRIRSGREVAAGVIVLVVLF